MSPSVAALHRTPLLLLLLLMHAAECRRPSAAAPHPKPSHPIPILSPSQPYLPLSIPSSASSPSPCTPSRSRPACSASLCWPPGLALDAAAPQPAPSVQISTWLHTTATPESLRGCAAIQHRVQRGAQQSRRRLLSLDSLSDQCPRPRRRPSSALSFQH